MPHSVPYTCNDYRQEMILLGLKRQLTDPTLSEDEKQRISRHVAELEKQMEME